MYPDVGNVRTGAPRIVPSQHEFLLLRRPRGEGRHAARGRDQHDVVTPLVEQGVDCPEQHRYRLPALLAAELDQIEDGKKCPLAGRPQRQQEPDGVRDRGVAFGARGVSPGQGEHRRRAGDLAVLVDEPQLVARPVAEAVQDRRRARVRNAARRPLRRPVPQDDFRRAGRIAPVPIDRHAAFAEIVDGGATRRGGHEQVEEQRPALVVVQRQRRETLARRVAQVSLAVSRRRNGQQVADVRVDVGDQPAAGTPERAQAEQRVSVVVQGRGLRPRVARRQGHFSVENESVDFLRPQTARTRGDGVQQAVQAGERDRAHPVGASARPLAARGALRLHG